MTKKRILWVSEASVLNTGFSNYTMEVLKRLHATGKYEIAELGSYIHNQDDRYNNLPWKTYAVMPDLKHIDANGDQVFDKDQFEVYNSDQSNHFGKWVFDDVLAEFKPDIVVDNRDWWMVEFQERTPFRRNFIWMLLVPVDGHPQKRQWIGTYKRADAVFGYSEYACNIIKTQSNNSVKVLGTISPGADIDIFKPMDKSAIREKFNIDPKLNVIGTVMRNQQRKLFPQLIQSFKLFRDKFPKQAANTYLYMHTSMPDVGWDIGELMIRYDVYKNCLFTYKCQDTNCGFVFASRLQGSMASRWSCKCPKCGTGKAITPNTADGVSREQLAEIYNLFDLYVQASVAEGFGMPIVEAKSCGVPIMATDNTAMSELCRNGGGFPIPVLKNGPFAAFTEINDVRDFSNEGRYSTMREWDFPRVDDMAKMYAKFIDLPDSKKRALSEQARKSVEKNYTWDLCASKWNVAFDETIIKDRSKFWDSPINYLNKGGIKELSEEMKSMSNEDFVTFLYKEILERTVEEEAKGFSDWTKGLNDGMERHKVLAKFIQAASEHNEREELRAGLTKADDRHFIV